MEQPREVLEREVTVLPQREHRHVLRVREPERLEQRAVEADERAGGRGDGEAQLRLDGERVELLELVELVELIGHGLGHASMVVPVGI